MNPASTAWDWYFSHQKPCWCLVTLTDGSQVYGLFGEKSFAGDQPEYRDLYLEEAFQLLDDGQWAPMEDTGGVLIMPELQRFPPDRCELVVVKTGPGGSPGIEDGMTVPWIISRVGVAEATG